MITLTLKLMKAAVAEKPERFYIDQSYFELGSVRWVYHVLRDRKTDDGVAVTKWRKVRSAKRTREAS